MNGRFPSSAAATEIVHRALKGERPISADSDALAAAGELEPLMAAAALLRDEGHGSIVTYSRKIFLPLTQLCRDVCHYCTFARPPRAGERCYLTLDEMLAVARNGVEAGCHEVLFTLGDKPELRYPAARVELQELGFKTTLDYLRVAAESIARDTGLLPHLNPGIMSAADITALRPVAASMGLMLESSADRLCARGGPHYGSPDKVPAKRLQTIEAAGKCHVPFTTGILIGIGETRAERIDSLFAIRELHDRFGHIQEVIIQNFRPKPGTRMAARAAPDETELCWTIAMARLILGMDANIQTPPNLNEGRLGRLINAGINDWGGVSPITQDFVNPEHAWPTLDALAAETAQSGKHLTERLAIYPAYARDPARWLDPALRRAVLELSDSTGHARDDQWRTGAVTTLPDQRQRVTVLRTARSLDRTLQRAMRGERLDDEQIATMFDARGCEVSDITNCADALRQKINGDDITYVVNRNINYTNICLFRCQFCAFSKGRASDQARGEPYRLDLSEIANRAAEAWERGATEVCLQGGIHPAYTGHTYIDICHAVKAAAPNIHVHAFSPLEIHHGAMTAGWSIDALLSRLIDAGLGSLPGTAAEILDDDVRAVICPDKLSTAAWIEVIETAHRLGLRTTSTIMFGHVEHPRHWARHLLQLRDLQMRTGGLTEFVPLPFVAALTPIYLKGRARPGPTFREAILMHAIARLALHSAIPNIQTSWVKMGLEGAAACLAAGANDIGGTLTNESISRAAGAIHGQELRVAEIESLATSLGRRPHQRTTVYGEVSADRGRNAGGSCDPGAAGPRPDYIAEQMTRAGHANSRALDATAAG